MEPDATQRTEDQTEQSTSLVPITGLAIRKAEQLAKQPARALNFIDKAASKADKSRKAIDRAWHYVKALIRMLRAYFSFQYRDVPWRSVVWALAALLYFVAPLDLIPDFLLGGLVDDAAVIMFVVRQIQSDIDNFLNWETTTGKPPAA